MSDEDPTFEEAMAKLQEIVDQLEGGELGLEEAMKAFSEAQGLVKICRAKLDEAEGKLEELLESGDAATFEVSGEE